MKISLCFPFVLVSAALIVLTGCSSGGSSSDGNGGNGDNAGKEPAPTASVTAKQVFLLVDGTIVVTFDAAMTAGSESFGGPLGSSAAGTWSTATRPNDTLTISPSSSWPLGHSQVLTVSAESAAGVSMSEPLSMTVEVFEEYLYANATMGNDGNGGTENAPFQTIGAAVTAADALVSGGASMVAVLVSEGTYSVDSGAGTEVTLSGGVSLFGGFSTGDWKGRDPGNTASTIEDTATSGNCAAFAGWNCVIVVLTTNATAANTMVDGFNIVPAVTASTTDSVGIDVSTGGATVNGNTIAFPDSTGITFTAYGVLGEGGLPEIVVSNNEISLGSHDTVATKLYGIDIGEFGVYDAATLTGNRIGSGSAFQYYGIAFFQANTATVSDNTIAGASSGNADLARGIYFNPLATATSVTLERNIVSAGTSANDVLGMELLDISGLIMRNNVVTGGTPTGVNNAYGIWLDSVAGTFQNNTLIGGTADFVVAIRISASTPSMENNILIGGTGASTEYCMFEADVGSDPLTFKNNAMDQCATALYRDENATDITSVSAIDALDAAYSSNVAANPGFVDQTNGDYRLTVGSPVTVREGGLDLSASFTDDAAGSERTVPFSIGAYEQD